MSVTETRRSFSSGGKAITVDVFEPGRQVRAPSVVMLHGADGLGFNNRYREGARAIAASGFQVNLVHYLDRTGERRASFATLFQNFLPWAETVRDALAWATERAESEKVGLVGISLGAALGLAVSGANGQIGALVSFFGPLPQGVVAPDTRLPPTLILHGAMDPVVPVANAYAIETLLRQKAVPYEIKVYPGEGHGFHETAREDATQRVLAFLQRHLSPEPLTLSTGGRDG
ncbi:dienelactone hydrolase family protein [Microvirga sp. 17 mud 1-3]|uniref:dienelactone hydrolase family protein n=1 Tax=Microvirga sp. 17 mud 1-3 TaxID=2082949 RepID=UPI000D6A817B|nr:dienelactone hydrolase family protein [Microvirga sp. 17 mud 1-3]AWM88556.1 dienelactone hydrolase [Microvirga sp. 17 mud 1-3]